MSPIRPLERDDLPGVASLFERVMRSGSRSPAPGLAAHLGRLALDHPWADPEIPSLVYQARGGAIVGFIGSHVRRATFDGRPVRLACSGQLVADPDHKSPGTGALLIRRYMAGPQDLTFTDGATDEVRAIWVGLGGSVNPLGAVGWTRIFRPTELAAAVGSARRGHASTPGPVRRVAEALDAGAGRTLRPERPETTDEELTAAALVEGVAGLDSFRLKPSYDEEFARWLFGEMEAVGPRGKLRRRLVRDPSGAVRGWYVYYLQEAGVSEVQQVVGDVLPHLLWDAYESGSAAVRGRLEVAQTAETQGRGFWLRRTEWQLVHSEDRDLRAALALGEGLLTRMEGEWWMGPHLRERVVPESALG